MGLLVSQTYYTLSNVLHIWGDILRLFRMKSILAITATGVKEAEDQRRTKSFNAQFVFGILSSLVAAFIYAGLQTLIFPR